MSVYILLNAGKIVEFNEKKVVIGFKKENSFHKETLEIGDNRKVIEEAVKKATGGTPRVEFTFPEFWGESAEESPASPAPASPVPAGPTQKIKPCIEKALDVFGGHVVRDIPEEKT